MTNEARYDAIAAWYSGWVGDDSGLIAEGVGGLLPSSMRGTRVLDVACGHGRAARGLARFGADVVGVDVSAQLIGHARTIEGAHPLGISYVVADVAEPDQWWNGAAFDGAVCEMAVMDIDDLSGTVNAVGMTVRPGGWFVVSMVHPCFPGNQTGLSSWPPEESYFDEGYWTSPRHNPDGARIRVGSSHRTLSTYLNTLLEAGFALERVVEPAAPVPTILLLRCRRAPAPST
jgi:2-polyprenyl-3-methyl-5-hydroxy-6-metoxy-1,4-benzoquinol methylase